MITLSSMKGTSSLTSAGVTSRTPSTPQAPAEAMRRAQLLHALLGARDLDAPAGGEHAQLLVLREAVVRQLGHLARVVDREDEVGGVAGRAARVRQRALVEQHQIAPAEPGQVVHEAVAHDAGADHDGARAAGQTPSSSLVFHGAHLGVRKRRIPDISHRNALVTRAAKRLVRDRRRRPPGRARRPVRGLLGAGPARGDRAPAVRRRGCERLDLRDDHRLLRPPARPRGRLLRLPRVLPLPRRRTARRPRSPRRLPAPQGAGRGGRARGAARGAERAGDHAPAWWRTGRRRAAELDRAELGERAPAARDLPRLLGLGPGGGRRRADRRQRGDRGLRGGGARPRDADGAAAPGDEDERASARRSHGARARCRGAARAGGRGARRAHRGRPRRSRPIGRIGVDEALALL